MKATLIAKRTLPVLFLSFISHFVSAQQHSAGVNIDSPNPNAVLHLVSPFNDQGLLIPKLTNAERDALRLTFEGKNDPAADNGIMVYDSEDDVFYFWVGGIGWIGITDTDAQDLTNVLGQGNDAGSNSIVNVADPTNAQDVATKNYVDTDPAGDDQDLDLAGDILSLTNDGTTVDLSGYLDNTDNQTLTDVLTNNNGAGTLTIQDLGNPINSQDAATKFYVDNQGDSDNQDLASVLSFGTSAAGSIIADVANPLSPQDAATKSYVDAQTVVIGANSITNTELANDAVQTGSILDGTITDADIADVAVGKVTGLGTAATQNVGTAVGEVLQFGTANTLPALDGSALTGVTAAIAANSINSGSIADGSIVDADVNVAAAIAGTKINPNFGAQNITTSGNISGTLAAILLAPLRFK